MELARFDEALAFVKKGNDLLPARIPLRERARRLLQGCQRYMTLDKRLPLILRGAEKPANAAEQIEFAQLCVFKKLCAAAARFYGDAFTAEPKLAEAVPAATRYYADCAAGEPSAIEAMSPNERRECLALWKEVAALLGRAQTTR